MTNLYNTFKKSVFGENCELAEDKVLIFYAWEHVDFRRWLNDLIEEFLDRHPQYTEKEVRQVIKSNFEEDLKVEYKLSRKKSYEV